MRLWFIIRLIVANVATISLLILIVYSLFESKLESLLLAPVVFIAAIITVTTRSIIVKIGTRKSRSVIQYASTSTKPTNETASIVGWFLGGIAGLILIVRLYLLWDSYFGQITNTTELLFFRIPGVVIVLIICLLGIFPRK